MNPPNNLPPVASEAIDLRSLRARKARLAKKIGKFGYDILLILGLLLALGVIFFFVESSQHLGYISASVAIFSFLLAIWYRDDLAALPPEGNTLNDRLSGEVLKRLKPNQPLTPQSLWQILATHWQTTFFLNHFLLPANAVEKELSTNEADMAMIWTETLRQAEKTNSRLIEPGHIVTALLLTSPGVQSIFTHIKLLPKDIESVAGWLDRGLTNMRRDKPYFGGIGRDWANGFTPQLNAFGHNISLSIERQGAHFGWLMNSTGVTAIADALSQNAGAIAMIGPTGIGKTSSAYALSQLLLQEKQRGKIAHRQVVELNSSHIISSAQRPGDLEHIVNTLLNETAHAGNIILFLDDAQLFFSNGPGAFDVTQILLPVAQSKVIQMIFAMTPQDYQALRSRNPAFAGLLTPVIMQELDESDTMRVLEDAAVGLEHQHKLLIAYEALREAYRLSGRYEQEMAYPGKAIQLLQQSLTHANQKIVTADSVRQAIEQTRGIKTGTATPVEATELLNLEDTIHKRMINQSRAVSVVSAALRRARAGVANPRRPIGSFLFLGPTGVGKTELAKAVAATYFGAETNMIRLDMSEYQQAEDVSRLLSDGQNESRSLILQVREQPFSVVLLDEIEKAHPNILNLLLQLLDEGQLTDIGGRPVSFKDCIVIATSNAGADIIRQHIEQGEQLESFEQVFTDQLIKSGQFKPELLNRFDEIVLFRPLNEPELMQVVGLMITDVNKTLATQNISVELTEAATKQIVHEGYDARLGARPMRRMIQRRVEDNVAERILRGSAQPGSHITLDVADIAVTSQR